MKPKEFMTLQNVSWSFEGGDFSEPVGRLTNSAKIDFAYQLLGSAGREEGVDELLKQYRTYINETPELTSMLYDLDMLPEQTISMFAATRLAGFCEVYKRMAKAEAAPAPLSPEPHQ